MLAAIVKVSGVIPEDQFLADMEGSFKHKFAKKPEVIDGNMIKVIAFDFIGVLVNEKDIELSIVEDEMER